MPENETPPIVRAVSPVRYGPRPLKPNRSFDPEAAVHSSGDFVATSCTPGREVTAMHKTMPLDAAALVQTANLWETSSIPLEDQTGPPSVRVLPTDPSIGARHQS
jgi:hypothetical protein